MCWIIGPAAVGKRTLAKKITRKLSCVLRLDKDVLQEAFSHEDRSSKTYKKYYRNQSYEALWGLALDNVIDGKSVIIHSPNVGFYHKHYINKIKERLSSTRVVFKLVYCIASEAEIRRRRSKRNSRRDSKKIKNDDSWARFVKSDPHFGPPKIPHLLVETTEDQNSITSMVIDFLMDNTSSI